MERDRKDVVGETTAQVEAAEGEAEEEGRHLQKVVPLGLEGHLVASSLAIRWNCQRAPQVDYRQMRLSSVRARPQLQEREWNELPNVSIHIG